MKVNLKKLGAIVAGAAILASSAAFAGLMFGSTTLVDDNGAPVAKVVVGSNALPSDAVAAALIANKIASETYKTETLTAQVAGSASCNSAASNSTTGGTCSVTNKEAQLSITVPGSVASGTYTFGNLIGDWVNRDLLDRIDNVADSSVNFNSAGYKPGGSDTSSDASPFTDGQTTTPASFPNNEYLYRIDGSMFSSFADTPITDPDSGNSYVEHQNLWVQGDNHYSTTVNADVGQVDFLAYTLQFDGPGSDQIGIPVCTRANNLDYTACLNGLSGTSTDDETASHRVPINFLGSQWVISDMTPPTSQATNDNTIVSGGSVKLAKESIGGILNQGESLPVDNLKFQLDDLEANGGQTAAIISVLDANGNVLKKDTIPPGETTEFDVAGTTYRVHVYKVAPGYTFGAKWADMAIYSQELTLADGQQLDQDNGVNKQYTVSLGWKNLDASDQNDTTPTLVGDQRNVDTLRTIVIYSSDISEMSSNGNSELTEGAFVPIVQDPVGWELSYKGLDLTSSDKESLKFEIETENLQLANKFQSVESNGRAESCTLYAPFVKVTSGSTGSIFDIDATGIFGSTTTLSDNEFYVTAAGTSGSGMNCTYTNGSAILNAVNFPDGAVVMKISPSATMYDVANYTQETGGYGYNLVKYSDVGDGSTAFAPPNGGAILIENYANIAPGDQLLGNLFGSASGGTTPAGNVDASGTVIHPDIMFAIAEKAGTGTSNNFVDYYAFGIGKTATGSASDALFQFVSYWSNGVPLQVTSDNAKILYGHATENAVTGVLGTYCTNSTSDYYCNTGMVSGPVNGKTELVQTGYLSERGSEFQSMSDRVVQFNMATKLANAEWFLGPTQVNATASDESVVTLGEGASQTIDGVTVKVLGITEDVGACSASGAAAACTSDMSGVSAVIMPQNTANVSVAIPYTGSYDNLVILDSDAAGVNTLISVGGNDVNSVTASLLQGSAVDWTATPQIVKEVVQGSKIVVAGYTAEDTLAAAQSFISQVQRT